MVFDAIAVMPTNLYGPHDNFSPTESHVLPALLRRFHDATQRRTPEVVVWGSGKPRREFLYVDDLAAAVVHVDGDATAKKHRSTSVPVKTSRSRSSPSWCAETVGFEGRIVFDPSKPDGVPRKLLDVSRVNALGWQAQIGLKEGIGSTYTWFKEHELDARR